MQCQTPDGLSFIRLGRARALTLLELVVVMGIIGILATLLLRAAGRATDKTRRIVCASQLRELGKAFHLFASDHHDRLPMQVAIAEGGSMEYGVGYNWAVVPSTVGIYHFRTLSNYVGTPRPLICPTDSRRAAGQWRTARNTNLSYFVTFGASASDAASTLAGDGSLTNLNYRYSHIWLGATNPIAWNTNLHKGQGNLLFCDGHVELMRNDNVMPAVQRSELHTNQWLVLPLRDTRGGDLW